MKAIISYRPSTQKIRNGFKAILNVDILRDICVRITGQTEYEVKELTDTYNKGRLLTLEYEGMTHYVTLSENSIQGRNSSLQSVPTAINIYYSSQIVNKKLWYYFIPYVGNPFTDYHLLYYRLMLTAGIEFLNMSEYYGGQLSPYKNVDELIEERSNNRSSNSGNNSSFVSKTQEHIQLYAKTYGANKYESTVLGVALSKIADRPIDIFAVSEQDLKDLPQSSISTFNRLGNISIYNTSLRLNRFVTENEDGLRLRSAAYNYNLLSRIGMKRCALCGCEIPEIIQGAHIWSVADIRNNNLMDDTQKYSHATSGHNGLWLCQNHHKLFDSNYLVFDVDGRCFIKHSIPNTYESFINGSIVTHNLDWNFLSDDFRYYLTQRNQNVDFGSYQAV